ncbi:hypothetical protein [uncultured Thiodictyon sp.]|uniref:hypothetical protein n=1 Tax=uncultured Thiodictyon sp. TaxID=1846217 RepID=UPI0025DD4ACC|nr:hypothetical protein [uncultured Thiodictyon sp.]
MNQDDLLAASCRLALGALLHDLGKFAERAGIEINAETLAVHLQLYARRQEAGGRQWYTHRHAAYTALAIDLLEPSLPRLTGSSMTPFAAWRGADADDSLINAAARHTSPTPSCSGSSPPPTGWPRVSSVRPSTNITTRKNPAAPNSTISTPSN